MILAAVFAAGILMTTGCAHCHKGTCCKPAMKCDGSCCKDGATCAKLMFARGEVNFNRVLLRAFRAKNHGTFVNAGQDDPAVASLKAQRVNFAHVLALDRINGVGCFSG